MPVPLNPINLAPMRFLYLATLSAILLCSCDSSWIEVEAKSGNTIGDCNPSRLIRYKMISSEKAMQIHPRFHKDLQLLFEGDCRWARIEYQKNGAWVTDKTKGVESLAYAIVDKWTLHINEGYCKYSWYD